MTSMLPHTGYGPRQCLLFDGDDIKYQLWEVKFRVHETAKTVRGNHNLLSELAARNLQMLTAIEELNSKLSTVSTNQRAILRGMQVGAVGPTSGDILGAIIIQLTSMEWPDQLEKNLLEPVERLLVSCALETVFHRLVCWRNNSLNIQPLLCTNDFTLMFYLKIKSHIVFIIVFIVFL